jgi:hypothetical protein
MIKFNKINGDSNNETDLLYVLVSSKRKRKEVK